LWLAVVHDAGLESRSESVRAFAVALPSGVKYWTVLDEDLVVVGEADAFLRHLRFGRDASELTTRSYAGGIALYLHWCRRTGRSWQQGVEHLGLFVTWLRHALPEVSSLDANAAEVLTGPGRPAVRGARRINVVLTAVRGLVVHAVTTGAAAGELLPLIYELADDRDLAAEARGEDARMAWRMRARHRLHEPETVIDRADDVEIVRLLQGCRSARDRPIVLLMARAGLRRGGACGLRRNDVHLLLDSQLLGCPVPRAHLHVLRRDNPNGAWAKSRRQRVGPLDFLVVQAFDAYEFERCPAPVTATSCSSTCSGNRSVPRWHRTRWANCWPPRAAGLVCSGGSVRTNSGILSPAMSPTRAAPSIRSRNCSATLPWVPRRSTSTRSCRCAVVGVAWVQVGD